MARTISKAPAKRSLPGKTCRRRTRLTQRPSPPPATTTTRVLRSRTKVTAQRPSEATDSGVTKVKSRRKRLDPWTPKRKPSKDPKPRASPATHLTCRICVWSLPRDRFIRWVPLKRWHGKPLDAPLPCIRHLAPSPYRRTIDPVCKTCIGSAMAARLDTLGARRVGSGCVEPGCSEEWPWEMILKYFPSSKLEAFNLASFKHWRTDTDLFDCLESDCSFTGLLDPNAPGYPQVECPVSTCRARSCATCLTPWHVDQTCAEVKSAALTAQMTNPEKETLALMQSKDGKRCPNCQLVIEKDGGCSSIFCSGCKTYFNWDTAASAVPGTKKALPIANGMNYWQMAAHVVCEVDALEGKVAEGNELTELYSTDFLDFLNNMDAGLYPTMPLPDEDDADL